jgi:hypothetical protein
MRKTNPIDNSIKKQNNPGINLRSATLLQRKLKPSRKKLKKTVEDGKTFQIYGRVNIVNGYITKSDLKIQCKFPSKISMSFFTEIEKSIRTFIWKYNRPSPNRAM